MNQKRQISLPAGKNRRLGMIVTSFQDLKLSGKQISQWFFDFELINSPKMVQKCTVDKKIRKCRRNLFSQKLYNHNHSRSPVFGLPVLCPTGSEM